MAEFVLVIGNKNYSSWSLRPWLVLKQLGVSFEEVLIPLYEPPSKAEILKMAPSGKVPILQHGPTVVWDSFAICEYLAELFPADRLWPEDRIARAHARAVSSEMHAGFPEMRQHLSMNVRRRIVRPVPTEALDEVRRVVELWSDCRARYAAGGDFLFGHFTIADAMYAPVAFRFQTYGIALQGSAARYTQTMLGLSSMRAWEEASRVEPQTIPKFEPS